MQPEARRRLGHVLDAGEEILEVTSGRTFEEYAADRVLRRAVERLFTIVGEALREAARADATIASTITEYRKIVDFRNVVVHDYITLYDEGVWRIRTEHLPRLLAEVRSLLSPP
jgi:uncharacterized protein with HEPN domain